MSKIKDLFLEIVEVCVDEVAYSTDICDVWVQEYFDCYEQDNNLIWGYLDDDNVNDLIWEYTEKVYNSKDIYRELFDFMDVLIAVKEELFYSVKGYLAIAEF